MKEKITEMVNDRILRFIESSPYVLIGLFVASVIVDTLKRKKTKTV